jgi:hypothetical protein
VPAYVAAVLAFGSAVLAFGSAAVSRWHVFVWDLWFLVWGIALGLAAWRYRLNDRSL